MADDDSLLDVFVNIKTRFDQDLEKMTQDVLDKVKDKFINFKLPAIKVAAPVVSGGSGGSGGKSGSGLAGDFDAAKRSAQGLQSELRNISVLISGLGDTSLTKSIRLAQVELQQINADLNDSKKSDDPLGLQKVLGRLDQVKDRVKEIVSESSPTRANTAIFNRFQNEESTLRVTSNVESSLRQQAVQGIPSEKRAEILAAAGDIKKQENALRLVANAFDGSKESLNAYLVEFVKLNGVTESVRIELAKLGITLNDLDGTANADFLNSSNLRGKLKDVQVDSTRTGSSFNNLSNNAYQAGQAIEDFAVGFSLNGIAGGIRGAANNVAFILNDMSRLPGVTNAAVAAVQKMKPSLPLKEAKELGEKYASMIPLAAGIGSAFAIVVLPKMVEWLQSLTEIEFKLQDIGEQIKRNVANAEFKVNLDIGSSKFARDLEDAQSIEDVTKRTNDLIQKRNDNQQQIIETTKALEDSGAFFRAAGDIKTALDLSVKSREAAREAISLNAQKLFGGLPSSGSTKLDAFVDRSLPGRIFGGTAGDKEKLAENLRASVEGVKTFREAAFALDQAQEAVLSGDPESNKKLTAAADLFAKISKEIDRSKKTADGLFFSSISADNAESLKKSLQEVGTELDKLNKLAKENEEIQNKNITQGLDAIIAKNRELAFGIKLAQAELKDTIFDGASEIDKIFIKNDKVREGIDDLLTKSLQSSDPNVGLKGIAAADSANATQSALLQLELGNLLKKSKTELKGLEEKNKTSTFTNFEDFVKKLQTNVLGADDKLIESQKNLTEKIEFLTGAIEREKENFDKNSGRAAFVGNRGAEERRFGQLNGPDGFRGGFGIPENSQLDSLAFTFSNAPVFKIMTDVMNRQLEQQRETKDAVKKIPGAVAQ